MERGIMARAMSLEDAVLLADVLGNEHIVGEYTMDELRRLDAIRHDLRVRIRQARRVDEETAQRAALA